MPQYCPSSDVQLMASCGLYDHSNGGGGGAHTPASPSPALLVSRCVHTLVRPTPALLPPPSSLLAPMPAMFRSPSCLTDLGRISGGAHLYGLVTNVAKGFVFRQYKANSASYHNRQTLKSEWLNTCSRSFLEVSSGRWASPHTVTQGPASSSSFQLVQPPLPATPAPLPSDTPHPQDPPPTPHPPAWPLSIL